MASVSLGFRASLKSGVPSTGWSPENCWPGSHLGGDEFYIGSVSTLNTRQLQEGNLHRGLCSQEKTWGPLWEGNEGRGEGPGKNKRINIPKGGREASGEFLPFPKSTAWNLSVCAFFLFRNFLIKNQEAAPSAVERRPQARQLESTPSPGRGKCVHFHLNICLLFG